MRRVIVDTATSRIRIEFEYNPELIAIVRNFPDRSWSKKDRMWTVPYSTFHAKIVKDELTPHGFQMHPEIFRLVGEEKKSKFVLQRDGLYRFQSEAIDFLNKSGGRALIADEQGLGKTIETLYWIAQKSDIQSTLIICPASVLYKWKAEIEKWDNKRTVSILEKTTGTIQNTNYVIMSYAIMTRKIIDLQDIKWDCVVFDECHKLKEQKSQRTRAARNLNAKYMLALSGTPVLNRPIEFFNILNMINPAQWGSWWNYVHRYCGARKTYWGLDTSGASNLDELAQRLQTCMIRRLKRDVLTELPDLTRTKIPVVVDGAEINSAYRNLYRYLRENDIGGGEEALARLALLRQSIGRAKIPLVVELAEEILETDEDNKVVIYAVHKFVVAELMERLSKYGVTSITGDIENEERSKRQKRFQEGIMPRVMIISSAGGEGIDLYRSSVIIFAEREWNAAVEEQAEARCHRIGQKNAVEAMYVIAKSTIDEDIDMLIDEKRSIIGQIIKQADIKLDIQHDILKRILKRGGG